VPWLLSCGVRVTNQTQEALFELAERHGKALAEAFPSTEQTVTARAGRAENKI
jgi:hypothetical protein